MKSLFIILVLAVFCAVAPSQQAQPQTVTPTNRPVEKGVLVSSVTAQAVPEQSYALYVPSTYAPNHEWPIVYVFDPGARGDRPLKLMKDAAERYGFILAGSNNSRNGDMKLQLESARQMWNDTQTYLAIDSRRIYFAGFSGGARLASYLAQVCGCSRAAFLDGAALLPGAPSLAEKKFAAFSLGGLGDFNYPEMLDLDNKLAGMGQPHFFLRFNGEHEWAPAPAWEQAFSWSALLEMKNNVRARDAALITAELGNTVQRIRAHTDSGNAYFALQEARGMLAVFDGLTDTTPLKELAATLEKDPRARNGAKQEKSQIQGQHLVADEIVSSITSLQDNAAGQPGTVNELTSKVRSLHDRFAKEKNPSDRYVLQRALGDIFIMCMETGGPILQKGDAANAQPYFQIAAEARPDWSWPFLSLARCQAARGNKKDAIRSLKRAIETGYSLDSLADFVKKDAKLAPLAEGDEYKAMITSAAPAASK